MKESKKPSDQDWNSDHSPRRRLRSLGSNRAWAYLKTLQLTKQLLENDNELGKRTPIKPGDIVSLIKSDLELAYSRWNDEYYKQVKGFGMGKSTSSPLSDIYMEDFEKAALTNYPTGDATIRPTNAILFWLRKADNTIMAIHNDRIKSLHTYLNSIHTDVQWTKEIETNGRIAMLDVTIIRNTNGTLDFDVYRKPTHTNQYIHFNSHQPLSHKFSTIHSLTRRAELLPSTDAIKEQEKKRVREALSLNGYPNWAYERARYRPPPPPPPAAPPPPPPPPQPQPLMPNPANSTIATPPPPPPPPPHYASKPPSTTIKSLLYLAHNSGNNNLA